MSFHPYIIYSLLPSLLTATYLTILPHSESSWEWKLYHRNRELKWKISTRSERDKKASHWNVAYPGLMWSQILISGKWMQGSSNLQKRYHYFIIVVTLWHTHPKKIIKQEEIIFYPLLNSLHSRTCSKHFTCTNSEMFQVKLISNWNYFIILDVLFITLIDILFITSLSIHFAQNIWNKTKKHKFCN